MTKQVLQKIALGFLKHYYKDRPRQSLETTARLNLTTEQGYIIDAYLSFETMDKKSFFATIEITTDDTAYEVRYIPQKKLLIWDATAIASLLFASFYSWNYIQEGFTVNTSGIIPFFSITSLYFLAFISAYFILFKNKNRYKYIYAIEQFKRYFANEHWIAVADTVFENNTDKYLIELKKQCVYNGIGLVLIEQDGKVYPKIMPPREILPQTKGKILAFLTNKVGGKDLKRSFKKPMFSFFNKNKLKTHPVYRYTTSYFHTILISILSFLAIGEILYLEWQNPIIVFVDEKTHEAALEDLSKILRPESHYFDTTYLIPIEESQPYLFISENPKPLNNVSTGFTTNSYTYNCARLQNFQKKLYCIQESSFKDEKIALKRAKSLKNVAAKVLWLGCFSPKNEYVVLINQFYEKKADAFKDAVFFKKNYFPAQKLYIRAIEKSDI